MHKLNFPLEITSDFKILCLGAHSDDLEIGCGGTVLRLISKHPDLSLTWVVFGAHGQRSTEAQDSANEILKDVKVKEITIKSFKDGYFPYRGEEIKDYFELLKKNQNPDMIFTHYRQDLHQDHRLISELTWNTFRNHLILEYEVPKYDGDLGSPNLFVGLDETICNEKVKIILNHFKTQEKRHWFTADTFLSLLRLRGIECGSPSKYAEAFYCRKMVL